MSSPPWASARRTPRSSPRERLVHGPVAPLARDEDPVRHATRTQFVRASPWMGCPDDASNSRANREHPRQQRVEVDDRDASRETLRDPLHHGKLLGAGQNERGTCSRDTCENRRYLPMNPNVWVICSRIDEFSTVVLRNAHPRCQLGHCPPRWTLLVADARLEPENSPSRGQRSQRSFSAPSGAFCPQPSRSMHASRRGVCTLGGPHFRKTGSPTLASRLHQFMNHENRHNLECSSCRLWWPAGPSLP